MKKKKPSFGHVQADYQLWNIFRRTAKEFDEASIAKERADQEYNCFGRNPELVWVALERRTSAGVILLMTASALLEQIINDYACTFLDPDSYEEHLGNVRTVTKWLLLPRLCQNKEVKEDNPAINALRELVKARNAIVHHKRREMDLDIQRAKSHVSKEIARFLSASKNAKATIDSLVNILTSPSPRINQQFKARTIPLGKP